MDIHKATIPAAVAAGKRDDEVGLLDVFAIRPVIIDKLINRLARDGRRLSVV